MLMGRLTRDPAFVHGATSDRVNFTLAVSRGFGKDAGTDFIPVVLFGKPGNNLANLTACLYKGRQVAIEGRLSTNKVENKFYLNVVASRVELIGPKKKAVTIETGSEDAEVSETVENEALIDV